MLAWVLTVAMLVCNLLVAVPDTVSAAAALFMDSKYSEFDGSSEEILATAFASYQGTANGGSLAIEDGYGINGTRGGYLKATTSAEHRVTGRTKYTVHKGKTYHVSVWAKTPTQNTGMAFQTWFGGMCVEGTVNGKALNKDTGYYGSPKAVATVGEWTRYELSICVDRLYARYTGSDNKLYYVEVPANADGTFPKGTASGTTATDGVFTSSDTNLTFDFFLAIGNYVNGTWNKARCETPTEVYVDNWYVIEEDSATSVDYAKVSVTNAKIANAAGQANASIGGTLTASASVANANPNAENKLSYQWQRSSDGTTFSDISGATSANYTVTDADAEKSLRVTITAESTGAVNGKTTAVATSNVIAVPDAISGAIAEISVEKATTVLTIGKSADLNAKAVDTFGTEVAGAEVTYTSSDPTIAKIDSGKVTAVREGLATITAKAGSQSKSYILIVYSGIMKEQKLESDSGLTEAYFADKNTIKEANSALVKSGEGSRTGTGKYWETSSTPIVMAGKDVEGKTYKMDNSSKRFTINTLADWTNTVSTKYGNVGERGAYQVWFYDDGENGGEKNNGKQVSLEFMGYSGTYQDANGVLYSTFPDGSANDGTKDWNLSFRVYFRLDGANNTYRMTQDSSLFGGWTQESTCPTRSKGWHQLIVDYTKDNEICFYVDGQKAFSRITGELPSNGGIARMGVNRHGISLEEGDANHYIRVSDMGKYDLTVTKQEDLKLNIGQGGKVEVGNTAYAGGAIHDLRATWGTDTELTITPDAEYLIDTVTVNGQSKTVNAAGGKLTVSEIKESTTVAVTFKLRSSIPQYRLSVEASSGGDVTVDTNPVNGTYSSDVYSGTEVTIGVTPNSGYQAIVKVNNQEKALTDGKLVLSVTAATTVTVSFVRIPKPVMTSISLSGNTSLHTEPLAETDLKIWGYDSDGKEVDLTGNADVFVESSAPWIFKVSNGKISSGTVEGSALITATYVNADETEVSGSIWMTRTSNVGAQIGFTTGGTPGAYLLNGGDMTGHDGNSVLAYYKKDTPYAHNYGIRAYVGRGTGDQNWYNKGLRAAQGWYYDDGSNNAGFLFSVMDNTYYNSTFDTNMASGASHTVWQSGLYPIGAYNNAEYYVAGSTTTSVKRTKGWHQVTVMLDTADKKMLSYIDGVQVASTAVTSSLKEFSDSNKGDSCIELRSTQGEQAGYQTNVTYSSETYFDDIAAYDLPQSEAPAMAPVVTRARVKGTAMVGQILTGDYSVKDYNEDELDTALLQWQVSEDGTTAWTDLEDADGESYILGSDLEGKYIRLAVTPRAKTEPKVGDTVYSSVAGPVLGQKTAPSASGVQILGTIQQNSTLTADYTYVKADGVDAEGTTGFAWEIADSAEGPFEVAATSKTFKITGTIAGKYLRVSVTPKDVNGLSGSTVSSRVVKIPGMALNYYVATDGSDSNPGTLEQPFATLEAARDAIRKAGVPDGGATVYIRGGVYYRTKTFALTSADSGREGAPVVYRPYGDEKVVIHGGYDLKLSDFTAVDGEMKSLLPSNAQSKVMVADLKALGVGTIAEYPEISANGGLNSPIISMDGQVMNLSRYPNTRDITKWPTMFCAPKKAGYEGTNLGNAQTDSSHAFTVQYDDVTAERVQNWTYGLDHIAAEGFWRYDWWASTRYVTIDKAKKRITAREDRDTQYGVYENVKRVFCFKNVYQELDEAGEYYIDFENQKLYVYPYEGATEETSFKMSNLNANLINMSNVSNVTIQGMELTSGKQKAISCSDGKNITVDGCYINGFQSNAMNITGSDNNIINNDMEFFGTGAITFSGGDKATITPGNNRIENNKINDFALLKTIYSAGVSVDGVGNYISHNDIYNTEHYAVYFAGVDNIIEYNTIHDACTNAADMGAIYTGRHFDDHGTIIRYNHFSNIGNPLSRQFFPCAIFTDDGSSDMDVYGNVFGTGLVNVEAIKVHGGQHNDVYHNLFVDTSVIFYSAEWDDARWRASLSDSEGKSWAKAQYWDRFDSVRNNPLYRERWPWLAEASDAYDNGDMSSIVHHSNIVGENLIIYVDGEPEEFVLDSKNPWKATKGWWRAYGNHPLTGLNDEGGNTNVLIEPDSANRKYFADYDNGNLKLTDESLYDLFEKYNVKGSFEPIPFEEIGMYDVDKNSVPTVEDVMISSSGSALTGTYEYRDAERDPEGKTTFRWLISDSLNGTYRPIAGETSETLTYDESLNGQFLKFEVTPVSLDGTKGTPVLSDVFATQVDTSGLNRIIDEITREANNAKVGTELGNYTAENVTALKEAIEAAKAVSALESATSGQINDALAELLEAYETFTKTAANKASTAKAEVNVPAGLEDIELTFTGNQTEVNMTFENETAPAMTISYGGMTVTIQSGTVIPGKKLKLALPEQPSVKLFGDVTEIVQVGSATDTFNKPIRIEFDGDVLKDVVRIDDTYEKITKTLNTDTDSALSNAKYGKIKAGEGRVAVWTTAGGEYASAKLYVPSKETKLKSLQINGKDYIRFNADTLSYQYTLPAGTTTIPTVTAEALDDSASVVISPATELPGTTTICVTAEDGETESSYVIQFLLRTNDETSNTVTPSTPDSNTSGNNGNSSVVTGGSGTVSVGNSNGNQTAKPSAFTDIIGHWAEQDINDMAEKGIVSGVTKTTFEPDRSVTRAEFAALIVRALGLENAGGESGFKDVSEGAWYADEVAAAAATNLISGYDGYFRPDDTITRQEMAVIIMKAYVFLGKTPETGKLAQFADQDEIADWAKTYVDQAVSSGLISGMTSDTFAPEENATRAQVTSLIKRLITR